MKTSYLFPHRLKAISGVVFVVSFLFLVLLCTLGEDALQLEARVPAIVTDFDVATNNFVFGDIKYFTWVTNPVADEICMLFILVSGIIFAFAKEKHEDEMVQAIRLNSLAWATIANYGILLFFYLFIYGFPFLNVLMGAMFSQLIIFILLFRYKMYRFYTTLQHEE
jgi:hypothetical protein